MLSTGKLPRIIFFVGVDGTGKTLYANMLLEELKHRGIDCYHGWSRYNNYLSKPLLGLTRLTGHNYKEYHHGVEFGYHNFGRSKILSYFFIFFQIFDLNIATYFKITRHAKEDKVLVCERGPYDTIVDVMLDTDRTFLSDKYVKRFLAFLPKDHLVFYLYRSPEKIYEDRPELKHDKTLKHKDRLYQLCYHRFGWPRIENVHPPRIVFSTIIKLLIKHNREDIKDVAKSISKIYS